MKNKFDVVLKIKKEVCENKFTIKNAMDKIKGH